MRVFIPLMAIAWQAAMDRKADTAPFEKFLQQSALQFPALDNPWSESIRINDRPYIHLVLAVADRTGAQVVYAEGLYELSDATIAAARSAAKTLQSCLRRL